jgi:sulfite dehydrogenase (cytochrome) subunit B
MRIFGTALFAALIVASAAAEEPVELKKAPGIDRVEANCGSCHSLDYIPMNSPFLSAAGWDAEIAKMINAFGAPIDQADAKVIADYLKNNYGTMQRNDAGGAAARSSPALDSQSKKTAMGEYKQERGGTLEGTVQWHRYVDPRLGTSVDLPTNIFTIDSGPVQKGSDRQFQSRDGRANLHVYTLINRDRDSPASYLKKHLAVNARILDYRRVTSRFFVVSGVRRGSVFYSRCNFETKTQGKLGCFFIEYPETETKAWDRIVTRMSLSLR